jgi:hypothetical protein
VLARNALAQAAVAFDELDVGGARSLATTAGFDLIFDLLPDLQGVEGGFLNTRVVKEKLAPLAIDEPKTTI